MTASHFVAFESAHFVAFESARILVVDDDPILREFAGVHLATPRVEVEVAENGEVAWHRLLQSGAEGVDLLLVDLEMPRMDGFELMGLIRGDAQLKHLPIVVITGREDMVAVDRAYAEGATAFVVKPLNWRVLSHQLSYVLRQSRDAQAVRRTLKSLQDANQIKSEVLNLAQRTLGPRADLIEARSAAISGDGDTRTLVHEIRQAASELKRLEQQLTSASQAMDAAKVM